jgi:hypothetical protein
VCTHCGCRKVAPGKRKYCYDCARTARTSIRRTRRECLKAEGFPAWQRNGWASAEEYRQYHREYMRILRSQKRQQQDARERKARQNQ